MQPQTQQPIQTQTQQQMQMRMQPMQQQVQQQPMQQQWSPVTTYLLTGSWNASLQPASQSQTLQPPAAAAAATLGAPPLGFGKQPPGPILGDSGGGGGGGSFGVPQPDWPLEEPEAEEELHGGGDAEGTFDAVMTRIGAMESSALLSKRRRVRAARGQAYRRSSSGSGGGGSSGSGRGVRRI